MSKDTTKKHDKLLANAYEELESIRLSGEQPTISMIARNTGMPRSTLNVKSKKWEEFKAVVKGKPTPKVSLGVVVKSKAVKESQRLQQIKAEVRSAMSKVDGIRAETARAVAKLVEQLHAYKALVEDLPQTKKQQGHTIQNNNELKKQIQTLQYEIRNLKAAAGIGATIEALPASKTPISVYPENRADLSYEKLFGHNIDAVNKVRKCFEDPDNCPEAVYVLCGNFAAGKSKIISEHRPLVMKGHKPLVPTRPLYIDGTGHTRDIRKLFLSAIRDAHPECRIICLRVMASSETCLMRNADAERKKRRYTVVEDIIMTTGELFQEVTADEGFDAIEIYGAKP